MIAVPLVLPLEQWAQKNYAYDIILVVFIWACIEEIFKWGAAYLAAFDTKEYDEPIDAVVYMLTAALGFAAMENVFFLVTSITNTSVVESLVTGNLRFIGATLLHVLSSGIIGLFMGLSFCKGQLARKVYLVSGLAVAILLHAVFNVYIMNSGGTSIFVIFCFVWVAILLLIAGFQKIKRMRECELM